MAIRTLAILIFDDVEVLDFCGPFEVFSVANRFSDPSAFNVLLVAEKAGPVLTRAGMSVNAHHRLVECPQPDILGRLLGEEVAGKTAKQMEYPWDG
jgi:transcriptional regulator GlxA family with amidase domain